MSVIWREEAREDILRITRYIAVENPIAAQQVARELFLAGESLSVFPRRGRIGRLPGTRELVAVARTRTLSSCEIEDARNVQILSIWHGAQSRDV